MKYFLIKALLVAATSLDAHSSWKASHLGYREINPVFASNGKYQAKGIAVEFSLTGGLLVVDYLQVRHHPERRNRVALTEAGMSGLKLGFAAHNYHTIVR